MRLLLTCTLALLSAALPLLPQEGHPLSGTWTGDAGGNTRRHITIVMNWDGKAISALLNPGPASSPMTVTLDPATWTVRMEAQTKDGAVVAEGKLENLGSIHRSLKGTWKQGAATSDFRVTRD